MAKLTKRMRVIREKVDATKQYDINEAIALLKELATAKFVESVDVAVNLGIDARKSDQNVRGATVLAARYWPFRSRSRIYPRCKC
ncbi:50S ribosomal protein L1 [Escherichia coli]|uniref:Large ribosomal subunit protein uL1 n=1 Tax=Escherichia coli TaxID=562 RepID=A0A2X1KDX7_ECOLX|nr:50S ribosomal protein L1 [Escherichia coli]